MAELRTKSGAEFDKAYAETEVAYHQAVIDAINQTLLPAIQNAELKAFVEKVGPAFQGHLEAAKQLQRPLRRAEAQRPATSTSPGRDATLSEGHHGPGGPAGSTFAANVPASELDACTSVVSLRTIGRSRPRGRRGPRWLQ